MEPSEEGLSDLVVERKLLETKVDAALDERIQRLLRSPHQKVMLTVPLESSHLLRRRHLVVLSSPVVELPRSLPPLPPRQPGDFLTRDSRTCSARVKMDRNSAQLDYCLLGVDSWTEANEEGEEIEVSALGFVHQIILGSCISLDGDGGFRVIIQARHFVFKPQTLQCLWTAIQTLHAISARLRPKRNSILVSEWDWVTDYEGSIKSPQVCPHTCSGVP